MRVRASAAAVVAASLLLAACGRGDEEKTTDGVEDGTFDIVFISGLSGPLEPVAGSMVASIKGAIDAINNDGGIGGAEVTLETLDGQGDPTKSVTVLQERLAEGKEPDLLFLGVGSSEVLAMLPIAARAGIPSLAASSSAEQDDLASYPLHRAVVPLAEDVLRPLPGWLEQQQADNVTVLTTQDATGDAYVQGVAVALEGTDVEIADERVSAEELDTSGTWDKIEASGADAVYVNCLGDTCARILDGRLKAGVVDIPVLGGTSLSGTGAGPASFVADQATLEGVDMLVYSFQITGEENPMYDSFVTGYGSHTDALGSVLAPALTWDGIYMWKYAVDAAGGTGPEDVVEALAGGLPEDDSFVVWDPLRFTANSVMPTVADDTVIAVPAAATLADDGRFVVE